MFLQYDMKENKREEAVRSIGEEEIKKKPAIVKTRSYKSIHKRRMRFLEEKNSHGLFFQF